MPVYLSIDCGAFSPGRPCYLQSRELPRDPESTANFTTQRDPTMRDTLRCSRFAVGERATREFIKDTGIPRRARRFCGSARFLRAPAGNGELGIRGEPAWRGSGFYIAEADIMVHMWVNTVTGCGLPREEINGLRFGPLVDRATPLVLVPRAGTGCP